MKLLADAGTSWTKTLEIFHNIDDLKSSELDYLVNDFAVSVELVSLKDKEGNCVEARRSLIPTKVVNKHQDILFDYATGHMSTRRVKNSGKYENELVAMALGAMKIIEDNEVILLDLGSRDSKWIRYKDHKYSDLDWNGTCGSGTGATIEMVCKFYDINPNKIPVEHEKIAVTCGVFGMEKIMDLVARGVDPDIAISRYIHGIAFNVWNFARCPEKLYLSGGLCLNKCFVESLKLYSEVLTVGRFILLEGLY